MGIFWVQKLWLCIILWQQWYALDSVSVRLQQTPAVQRHQWDNQRCAVHWPIGRLHDHLPLWIHEGPVLHHIDTKLHYCQRERERGRESSVLIILILIYLLFMIYEFREKKGPISFIYVYHWHCKMWPVTFNVLHKNGNNRNQTRRSRMPHNVHIINWINKLDSNLPKTHYESSPLHLTIACNKERKRTGIIMSWQMVRSSPVFKTKWRLLTHPTLPHPRFNG